MNIDLPVLGQKPSASSVSVIGASDDLLRVRALEDLIAYGKLITASGDDTVLAAPSAGNRLRIYGLRVQAEDATAFTALVKFDATNPTRVRCSAESGGLSEFYPGGIPLPAATAFVINISAAAQAGVSVVYVEEDV